jgi:hypothetical protein
MRCFKPAQVALLSLVLGTIPLLSVSLHRAKSTPNTVGDDRSRPPLRDAFFTTSDGPSRTGGSSLTGA